MIGSFSAIAGILILYVDQEVIIYIQCLFIYIA